MRFTANVERLNGTLIGVVVPPEAMMGYERGRRTRVQFELNGHAFLGGVVLIGGAHLLALIGSVRAAAGVAVGDRVEIEMGPYGSPQAVAALANAPAPVEMTVPVDFADALDRYPAARQTFDRLADAERLRRVVEIEEATTETVRRRRIDRAVALLRDAVEPGFGRGWRLP